MNKGKELNGIWFLPESPEIEVAGTFYYEPGVKMKLSLIGDLRNRTEFHEYFDDCGPFAVIHGITIDGANITLFECHASWTVKTYAVPSTQYSARSFIEGIHMLQHDQPLFDKITVNFEQLLRWLGHMAFTNAQQQISDKSFQNTVSYSPDNELNISYLVEPGFELTFNVTAVAHTTFDKCIVSNIATVSIQCSTGLLPIWELVRRMNVFRTFLSLGLFQPVPYLFIKLNDDECGKPMTYYYLERGEQYEIKEQPFLYNFSRIKIKLPVVLKSWYDSTETMFPIRVHLLEAILTKPTFHSTDFLIISFALEGFYHRFLKTESATKGNLSRAVADLYRIFRDLTFLAKIKINPEIVNDSRNYYAHLYQKDPSKKIISGVELLKVSEKLKILLVISVLKQMGLEIEDIEQCISNSDLLNTVNSF